ncbi:MAG: beta strand repeat-containing protein, partial [Pirellulales bacterium]
MRDASAPTTILQNDTALEDFWVNRAGVTGVTNATSPRVVFDRTTNRWFAAALDETTGTSADPSNSFLVAISNTSDPRAGWRGFLLDADIDDSHRAIGPIGFGIDRDAVYITSDTTLLVGSGPGEVSVMSIPKSRFSSGSPSNFNVFLDDNALLFTGPSPQPIIDFGPSDGVAPMFSATSGSTVLRRSELRNTSSSFTTTLNAAASVPVGFYAAAPTLTQPGVFQNVSHVTPDLTSLIRRVDDSLWIAHSVRVGGRSGVRWYEVDEPSNTVLNSGTISNGSLAFHSPSIVANSQGDVAIGFTGSSAAVPFSSYASLAHKSGGLVTFTDSITGLTPVAGSPTVFETFLGTGSFEPIPGTAGRYSATVIDSADPSRFWTFQQYISADDEFSVRATELLTPVTQETLTVVVNPNPTKVFSEADEDIVPTTATRETTVTLTRTGDLANALPVRIRANDALRFGTAPTDEIWLVDPNVGGAPTTDMIVTIPATQATLTLDIELHALDDTLFDGSQSAIIGGTAYGYDSVLDIVDVSDDEVDPTIIAPLVPNLPASLSESPATPPLITSDTLTFTRTGDARDPVTVQVGTSDPSEALFSPVRFAAPGTSTAFSRPDSLFDGTQTVKIIPLDGTATNVRGLIDVLDNEPGTMTIDFNSPRIDESSGPGATTATIRLANAMEQDVTIHVRSNDPSEVTLTNRATGQSGAEIDVVIPALQTTAVINVDAVDELIPDGEQLVTLTAYTVGVGISSATTAEPLQVVSERVVKTAGIETYDRLGDVNLHREQGQLRIEGNTIRFADDWGINVESSDVDNGTQTHPGPLRNFPRLSTDDIVPGAWIVNNVVANLADATGGIRVSGETTGNPASNPFVRIVNNTIFGEEVIQQAAGGATDADIVFMVDTSGSMGSDITELRNRFQTFDQELAAANINPRYGLVTFPARNPNADARQVLIPDLNNNSQLTDFVDFASFINPNSPFMTFPTSGLTEKGSQATLEALNQFDATTTFSYRAGAVPVPIILTDEDDDSVQADATAALAALLAQGGIFFGITLGPTSNRFGNTAATYGAFAQATNGRLFDIGDFRNDPSAFFLAFSQALSNSISGAVAGVGITVENGASPTILNNILANTDTGLNITGSAGTSVVGANFFQRNNNHGFLGTDAIVIDPDAQGNVPPLFVQPGKGNFYPASGTLAIDSSLNSFQDRPNFVVVKSPLGIPESPIVAPEFDAFGQKRIDDPQQTTPAGLGIDIFKDRGAIERADFDGGIARLDLPRDSNDGVTDHDPNDSKVWLQNPSFSNQFIVELVDDGVGIDDSLVSALQFGLFQDGRQLQNVIDYSFTYNSNSNRAIFTSITTFPLEHTYTITVDSSPEIGIRDLAGNLLLANQTDGTIRFDIVLTDDNNDAPINTSAGSETIAEGGTVAFSSAAASLEVPVASGTLFFTEKVPTSHSVLIDINHPGASDSPLQVEVTGLDTGQATIAISLETDSSGVVTTTVAELAAAVQANLDANALVSVTAAAADTNVVLPIRREIRGTIDFDFGSETLTFAKKAGVTDLVQVGFVDPGNVNQNLQVSVAGAGTGLATITVRLATDPTGAITSTVDNVMTAIANTTESNNLVSATTSGDGSTTVFIPWPIQDEIGGTADFTFGGGALTFTRKDRVTDQIEVELVDPGNADQSLGVSVAGVGSGKATITVSLATDSLGAIVSTVYHVISAITNTAAADALVSASTSGRGNAIAPVVAPQLEVGSTVDFRLGADTLTFSKKAGVTDQIEVGFVDPGVANQSLGVSVAGVGSGKATITVRLATDGTSAIISTVDNVMTAIANTTESNNLVSATTSGPGTTVLRAWPTRLEGGGTVDVAIPGETLTFTKQTGMAVFDRVDIELVDPGMPDQTLGVAVAGVGSGLATITVNLATDSSGAITTTTDEIAAAIAASAEASPLVTATSTGRQAVVPASGPRRTKSNPITVSDSDAYLAVTPTPGQQLTPEDGVLRVTLTASHNGTLTLRGTTGLNFTTGDGTDDPIITMTGTAAQINAALNGLVFTPPENHNDQTAVLADGNLTTVTIKTEDEGRFGPPTSGNPQEVATTITINIAAVNDAPVFTQLFGTQTVDELLDQPVTIAFQSPNIIAFEDVDADEDPVTDMTVKIAVVDGNGAPVNAKGTVKIDPVPSGVTVDNNDSAVIQVHGTKAELLDALQKLQYVSPDRDFNTVRDGAVALQLTIHDNGNTGGGDLADTVTISIVIDKTQDAPVVDMTAGQPAMASIFEDDADGTGATGTLISDFVAANSATVFDPDGAVPLGIAITAAGNTNGVWE